MGFYPKLCIFFMMLYDLPLTKKKFTFHHLSSEDGTTKYFPMTSLLAEKNHGYKIKQTQYQTKNNQQTKRNKNTPDTIKNQEKIS